MLAFRQFQMQFIANALTLISEFAGVEQDQHTFISHVS